MRKRGKGESTCSPLPAAETLTESSRRRRDKSLSPTSVLTQTYLSFSINTELSFCLFLSYLHPVLLYPALIVFLFPQLLLPCNLCPSNLFFLSLFFPFFLPSLLFFFVLVPLLLSPFIPRNELVMTVVWSTAVKENCNYKNVTPGYAKRMREKPLLSMTSVLCWRDDSN